MPEPTIDVLIADDEPLGRDLVRHLLAAHPDMRIVGECADGEKTVAAIKRHAPQLLLLDIQMPRLDGMKLIEKIEPATRPLTVFITAHDSYAIKAFEAQAFDYLLKPFDAERFDQMLVRVRQHLEQLAAARLGQSVRHLITSPANVTPPLAQKLFTERIVIRESGRVTFVDVATVEWLEASGNYVALHVADGKTHLVHETMAGIETTLDPARFVRIHRSTIVRIDRIKELQPHFNGEFVVVLKDDARLKLSRSYAETARAALGLR